ncbi:MAG: hypothetical protein FJ264_07055 [Planctomycetes bacterium]|nr:hypothetical protein [Planctomycetota bacterium]
MGKLKFIKKKYRVVLLIFLILSGCFSTQKPPVTIAPSCNKRIYEISKQPLTMGIYIDPVLRNHEQKEKLWHQIIGIQYFVFPVGMPLAKKIEETCQSLFNNVVFLNNPEDKALLEGKSLDGILEFRLKNSDIHLRIEEAVLHAIGEHYLSLYVMLYDTKQNKLWEDEVFAEGKGLDVVTSQVEWEWWITSGPKFGPAVDMAIENITYNLAQKLTVVKEILGQK